MFGCKAYGVEVRSWIRQFFCVADCFSSVQVETEPVRLARAQAEREGLTPLCTFLENSFAEDFFVGWLEKVGATHVFAYDKARGRIIVDFRRNLTCFCPKKKGLFQEALEPFVWLSDTRCSSSRRH